MVHKRRSVAGDSPAATSERLRVANINRQIAEELGVREQQVEATVALLDGGATVPFVARYRKEITGALDDAQLRTLEERLNYLRELEERRITILTSVREQGKLDAALEAFEQLVAVRRLAVRRDVAGGRLSLSSLRHRP